MAERKTGKLDAAWIEHSKAIAELFTMLQFLEKNPSYNIDDYLREFSVETETLVKLGR